MTGLWSIIIPEAGTNLMTNPSFETGTTGWSDYSTSSLSQSSLYSKYGAYSMQMNTEGTNTFEGAVYTVTSITSANTQYTMSAWVYGASGTVRIQIYDDVSDIQASTAVTLAGGWKYLSLTATFGAGSTTRYIYVCTSAQQDITFYADGIMLQQLGYATTYIDGDQEGCEWTGTAHASTSTRDAQYRGGGRVYNLDDYDFFVTELSGYGMPPIAHSALEYSLQPGSEYQSYKVGERAFALIGEVIGTSRSDLHAERKGLIDAIKPDLVKGAQPFKLRYSGADTAEEMEIECVYAGGLEGGRMDGFSERVGIKLIAHDPFVYGIGDEATVLTTTYTVADVNYITALESDTWNNMDEGVSDDVFCITYHPYSKRIYAGGAFTAITNADTAGYVAYWDGDTWNAMDSGLNGVVRCIEVAPNGDVYIGGDFTDKKDAAANTYPYIVKYDGDTYSAVAGGLSDDVHALTFDYDGTLYIGGKFTDVFGGGGGNFNFIATFDGDTFAAPYASSGFDSYVYALETAPNGDIYAGGKFSTVDGTTVNSVAKYDGSTWSALGAGFDYVTGAAIYALLFANDGTLYAGGAFTTAGGVTTGGIAKWNGSAWSAVGSSPFSGASPVRALAEAPNGYIYAVGSLGLVGNVTTDAAAYWNGYTWNYLDVNLPGAAECYAICITPAGNIYIGHDQSGSAVASKNNTSINNTGTSTAYPVIKIKSTGVGTTATAQYIKNETTGAALYFNYPILNGEELTIDCRPGKRNVWSNYWSRSQFGLWRRAQWRGFLRGSDFAKFYLLPGNNDISVNIIPSGSPTIVMRLIWRPTYWSFDGTA